MGTNFAHGAKPENRITISRGLNTSHTVKSDGTVDRSFAQPNPTLPEREVPAKAHASEDDKKDAIARNSSRQASKEASGGTSNKSDDKSGQDSN